MNNNTPASGTKTPGNLGFDAQSNTKTATRPGTAAGTGVETAPKICYGDSRTTRLMGKQRGDKATEVIGVDMTGNTQSRRGWA